MGGSFHFVFSGCWFYVFSCLPNMVARMYCFLLTLFQYVSFMHGVSPTYIAGLSSPESSASCDASSATELLSASLSASPAPPSTLEVVRINPLPAVAHHAGIAAIYPPHPLLRTMFDHMAEVFEVETIEEFHKVMELRELRVT